MDRTGLQDSIFDSIAHVDHGFKWQNTDGFEAAGRILYHDGVGAALEAFKEAQKYADEDIEILILDMDWLGK